MDGEISKSVRIVLGGVAPIRWRLEKVEAMFWRASGSRWNWLLALAKPLSKVRTLWPKNAYKVPLTKALVRPMVWLA